MEKWLCWGALGIAGFLAILFILDLALGSSGILFRGAGMVVDIISILCCLLLGYLAWDALRDLT